MRKEVEERFQYEWWNDEKGSYHDQLESIVQLKLTDKERVEIGELLEKADDSNEEYVGVISGVMFLEPHPIYQKYLLNALNPKYPKKRVCAIEALLKGGYEGALELLFSEPGLLEDMGERFPSYFNWLAKYFTEDMQKKVLDLFAKRFEVTPDLNLFTSSWFGLLEMLTVTNDTVAAILVRVMGELSPRDVDRKYLVLTAMAANPHPSYEPFLKKMAKSKCEDIRDAAREGLKKFQAAS